MIGRDQTESGSRMLRRLGDLVVFEALTDKFPSLCRSHSGIAGPSSCFLDVSTDSVPLRLDFSRTGCSMT